MASKEQSVTLLRRNKRAQVEALNSLGFNLTEGARAADFPMYIKWGAGLLDVTVAANRKSDNKKFFFTVDEWLAMTATEHQLFLLRGVRVRACATSFIIAPDTITNKAFGPRDVAAPNMHSFSTKFDIHSYFEAREETEIIVTAYANAEGNGVSGAPAAEAAYNYRAYTEESDGLEDTSEWALPTPAHLVLMFRYFTEINQVISIVWSSDFSIVKTAHWACAKYNNSNFYKFHFQDGGLLNTAYPETTGAVRPVCAN